jgi:hypothetical protein
MQNKSCTSCSKEFIIDAADLEFYDKIAPIFDGKKFVPLPPVLCPDCRNIKRSAFRNERNLYKRKCDKSGKEIISIYSADKSDYKVYDIKEYYKDDWDALEYGRDFDFNRPFFEQFDQLLKAVPRQSLFNTMTEGCEYSNYIAACKNCYMSMICYYNTENSHFCYRVYTSKDNMDLNYCIQVEKCYECAYSNQCFGCRNSVRLNNCRDCYLSVDLTGCNNCILCSNLNRKEYCIRNVQYSKKEFEKLKSEFDFGSRKAVNEYLEEFEKLKLASPVKYANLTKCEDCEGDNLVECKNSINCFDGYKLENAKNCFGEESKNIMDARGGTYEWALECNHTGFGQNFIGCSSTLKAHDMYYCDSCQGGHDCFGCVGLRNKEYCIFNKQYSKEEYGKLASRIAEKMIDEGVWGHFYPLELSSFGYNETLAQVLFPKTKEEAIALGAKWQDNDYSLKFDGKFYEPLDDIKNYISSSTNRDELLAGILKCKTSEKAYRIMSQELAFYLDNSIPIPDEHYDVRFDNKFKMRTYTLYDRACMCHGECNKHQNLCPNKFKSAYSKDSNFKVFCESCYQNIIK